MRKSQKISFALKLFVLLSVIFAVSCRSEIISLAKIPVPNGAEKGVKYPEYNTQIDLATNFIIAELKKKTGIVDDEVYTLDEPTEWNKLVEFYDSEMKKINFVQKSVSPANAQNKVAYYTRDGQTIAVVLIILNAEKDGSTPKPQFLMLATDSK